jgi:CheY-like chemotaxis protein
MKLLYLNRNPDLDETVELLSQSGYEVVSVTTNRDALEGIRTHSFDAFVIGGEGEDTEILDLTLKANRAQPELPVFLLNDWGSELVAALNCLKHARAAGQYATSTSRLPLSRPHAPRTGKKAETCLASRRMAETAMD